jgi:hypothetical protein
VNDIVALVDSYIFEILIALHNAFLLCHVELGICCQLCSLLEVSLAVSFAFTDIKVKSILPIEPLQYEPCGSFKASRSKKEAVTLRIASLLKKC